MTVVSAAKTILEADGTLVALATGGIWDFDETGRLGLNRTLAPSAFDSYGIIKPCILLKQRAETPNYILADDANKYVSTTTALECWFYEEDGYTNIEAMRNRVYALLHAVQLSGTFSCLWSGDVRPGIRDEDIDANVERSDYQVQMYRSAS